MALSPPWYRQSVILYEPRGCLDVGPGSQSPLPTAQHCLSQKGPHGREQTSLVVKCCEPFFPLTKAGFTWRGDQDALEKPDSSLILLPSKDPLFSKSELPSPHEARLVRRDKHVSSLPQWKMEEPLPSLSSQQAKGRPIKFSMSVMWALE